MGKVGRRSSSFALRPFTSRQLGPIQTPSLWITTSLFICSRKHSRTQTQHVEDVLPLHLWMLRGIQVHPGKKMRGGCCDSHAKPKPASTLPDRKDMRHTGTEKALLRGNQDNGWKVISDWPWLRADWVINLSIYWVNNLSIYTFILLWFSSFYFLFLVVFRIIFVLINLDVTYTV